MRAFLINAADKTITPVEVNDGLAGIRRLIGYDSVDSDAIGADGDRLWFDESCFIRQQDGAGSPSPEPTGWFRRTVPKKNPAGRPAP